MLNLVYEKCLVYGVMFRLILKLGKGYFVCDVRDLVVRFDCMEFIINYVVIKWVVF